MKAVGYLIAIGLHIPAAMLRGVVFSSLWLWFVVPLGVHPIGIAAAIGLSMTVNLVTNDPFVKRDDELKGLSGAFARPIFSVLISLISWGIGAIVAAFL